MEKKIIILVLVVITIIAVAIGSVLLVPLLIIPASSDYSKTVTNFEECIAAGNPAMESYPRQCRDPVSDRTFVEQIEDSWRLDGIILMRHETEGFYGCFGCDTPQDGPALCVDPVPAMKQVEETSQRYCDSNFEVVTSETNVGSAMSVPRYQGKDEMIVEENIGECRQSAGYVWCDEKEACILPWEEDCSSNNINAELEASFREKLESAYPEFKDFEHKESFAGNGVKMEIYEYDRYYAYITFGSGLPIVNATCFRVDRMGRVFKIGVFGDPLDSYGPYIDINPRNCRGIRSDMD